MTRLGRALATLWGIEHGATLAEKSLRCNLDEGDEVLRSWASYCAGSPAIGRLGLLLW